MKDIEQTKEVVQPFRLLDQIIHIDGLLSGSNRVYLGQVVSEWRVRSSES
jgi:hypothetical protein